MKKHPFQGPFLNRASRKKLLAALLAALTAFIALGAPLGGPIAALAEAAGVAEKVSALTSQWKAEGVTGEWEIALWLHDWLTHNANYDYTYSVYGPEGVLLQGTGVCQSYTEAYALLLNEAGISNHVINAPEMDHAWNLVLLEGKWCHIDVTWDDPDTGGKENHDYFGMTDALIARDHQWTAGSLPAATSDKNFYPIRMGMNCFTDKASLEKLLKALVTDQVSPISLVYTGTDSAVNALGMFEEWFSENNWKYGLRSYGANYSDYSCTLTMEYTDPWEKSDTRLDGTAIAPSFTLDSPEGRFILDNYKDNGVVLIFGRNGCMNTASLLDRLAAEVPTLNAGGIEVLICLENASTPEDIDAMRAKYDGGFHYTYDLSSLLWQYLSAVGYDGQGVTYPCIFVINNERKITYYSTGYISNMDELIGEAFATATGKALPAPDTHYDITPLLNGQGNVNSISDGGTIVSAVQAASASRQVILLMDYGLWDSDAKLLEYYEKNFSLFNLLGVSLVASFVDMEGVDTSAYPHCSFVDYSNDDFWDLLWQAGFSDGQASYATSMLVGQGGDILAFTNSNLLSGHDCALCALHGYSFGFTLPAATTVIDEESFTGAAFTSVNLPSDSLKRIQSKAFANCSQLRLIRIPESVTVIAEDAFKGCKNLTFICSMNSVAQKYAADHGFSCLYG